MSTDSNDDDNDGDDTPISVTAVINTIMRFQGIILTDRSDLVVSSNTSCKSIYLHSTDLQAQGCTERIFGKATAILNTGGHSMEDEALVDRAKFDQFDQDGSGQLQKPEVSSAKTLCIL